MKRQVFALCVVCLLLGRTAVWTAPDVPSSLRVLSVTVGDEVTLKCVSEETIEVMFFWYKQKLGEEPKMVSSFYRQSNTGRLTNEFHNNSRFHLESSSGKNHLKISNVQLSDTATYYCISGYALVFRFLEGITVIVVGLLNFQGLVYQSASERIQPGGSVTLTCTVHTEACAAEHSVYWLKRSKDPHPGVIYTNEDGSDRCEKNTQTHTCVYNLSLKSLDLSNAGTYYCAVALCGHILFGNGTQVDMEDEVHSLDLIHFLSGAVAFTTLLLVFLACAVYRVYKANSGRQGRHAAVVAPNMQGHQDADNLHYADVMDIKHRRLRRQQDKSLNECVYSSVK